MQLIASPTGTPLVQPWCTSIVKSLASAKKLYPKCEPPAQAADAALGDAETTATPRATISNVLRTAPWLRRAPISCLCNFKAFSRYYRSWKIHGEFRHDCKKLAKRIGKIVDIRRGCQHPRKRCCQRQPHEARHLKSYMFNFSVRRGRVFVASTARRQGAAQSPPGIARRPLSGL